MGKCRVSCAAGGCDVYVHANINLFRDPITEWGLSKPEVIAKEGSDYSQTSNGDISYATGNEIAPNVGYMFQGGVGLKAVLIPIRTGYQEQVVQHMKERYRYVGEDGGVYYFADGTSSSNAKTAVTLKYYNSNYWQLLYFPY